MRKTWVLALVVAVSVPGHAQAPSGIEMMRVAAIHTSIGSCMAVTTRGVVKGFIKGAAAKGKHFKDENEAKAELVGNVLWRKALEPTIFGCCKELLEPFVTAVEKAGTQEEIAAQASQMATDYRVHGDEAGQKMEACMADGMRRIKSYADSLKQP